MHVRRDVITRRARFDHCGDHSANDGDEEDDEPGEFEGRRVGEDGMRQGVARRELGVFAQHFRRRLPLLVMPHLVLREKTQIHSHTAEGAKPGVSQLKTKLEEFNPMGKRSTPPEPDFQILPTQKDNKERLHEIFKDGSDRCLFLLKSCGLKAAKMD